MFKIRYKIFFLFVLLLCIGSSVYAPIGSSEEVDNSGIKIISQDYIDSQFDWTFTKINDTTYFAEFKTKELFLKDAKDCELTSVDNKCWDDINSKYLSEKESKTKVSADLKNMSNYPLKALTDGLTFSKLIYDETKMSGSFYMFLENPDISYSAKFGFGSTIISTTTTSAPWWNNGRQVCIDGIGYIHTTWTYNDSIIRYARSTDSGATWSTQNITFSDSSSLNAESGIGCSGNGVSWGAINESGFTNNIIMMLSTDNGATFNKYTWAGNCADDYFNIELRGTRVYATCRDKDANGTDFYQGWLNGTRNFEKIGILRKSPSNQMNRPSMAVVGTGTATDKIYVVAIDAASSLDPYFTYSNDAGSTWAVNTTITSTNTYIGRLIADSTSLYFVGTANLASINSAISIYNSSDGGLTWTANNLVTNATPTERFAAPTISFIQSNLPCVIYETYNTTGINENNLSYICKNTSTTWGKKINTGLINVSIPSSPSQYYNDGKLHFIFRNQTPSPDTIIYDYVKPLGKNMIMIDNGGNNQTSIGNEIFIYPFSGASDAIPPAYSLNSTNSTVIETSIKHSLYWTDSSLAGYIFSFCDGTWTGATCIGGFVNDSWVAMTGTGNWSNVTKTIGSNIGLNYSWCVYANDTSGNMGSSCAAPFVYVSTSGTPDTTGYLTGFTKCKNITINNTMGSTLTNFPVNINVTYDSDMQADMDDLRFYNSACNVSGSLLYAELESKTDSANSYVWIKTNLATGINTISMYYGNSSVSNNWDNGTNVWDESFVLVMHLNDTHDSSKYANNGLVQGATQVTGIWGNAYTFNGLTNMINITNSRSLNMTSNITIETFVYPIYYVAGLYPRIVQKESGTTATPYGLDLTPSNLVGVFTNATGEYGVSSALNTVPISKWTGAGTGYNGATTSYAYLNGTQNATGSVKGPLTASNNNVRIGNNPASSRAFNGTIDEVRLSNVSRSAAWINMTFQLIANNLRYVAYGTEEPAGGATDSCTCPGLNVNWLINLVDNCEINTACYLGTGHLNFTNAGNAYINATINTTGLGYPPAGGIVWIRNLGVINVK